MKDLTLFHNTLNEADTADLRRRMENAETDTKQVYELAKSFGELWRRKAFYLYQEIYKKEIQVEEIGRALTNLCLMDYLIDTGRTEMGDKGAPNKVYIVNPNPPKNPVKIPKKICVPLDFKETENGIELDLDAMSDVFIKKLNYYDNIILSLNKNK